ncbi:unnamed protein product [Microthlaspi erraticum]|uniref:MULE transposase domain-containing protein n=1 Tax=Microthlaspi erraticum TaxID=1685480 RepID=A0A6D2HFV5_9BRAS|nr:unnamed protein product [Microthlaspi erraticum]
MALAPPNDGERLEFDDEEVEREEFQLDELLREFQNEPSIQHRQLPETDDEAEDDGEARAEAGGEGRERMVTRISRGDGHLYKDQTFFNGVAFKERVLDYALRTRWNISQYRYDKDKIGFECAGREKHTCQKTGHVELVKVPVIARPQCQAGRNKALKWISSEYDQQFARLKDYAKGRDADNAIYPIAWGVVEVENNENWQWFVQKLKVDLDLKDGDRFIAVSDRHKGLVRAIKIELPKMEHRKCVRHIYGNLKKKHGSKKQMKQHIWRLAESYNEVKFQVNLDRLRCYDTWVYNDVMATSPRSWCMAFYKLGNYCEDVENNSTESFNSSINKAREKPFIPMLEAIARLAMARIAVRSRISHEHTVCNLDKPFRRYVCTEDWSTAGRTHSAGQEGNWLRSAFTRTDPHDHTVQPGKHCPVVDQYLPHVPCSRPSATIDPGSNELRLTHSSTCDQSIRSNAPVDQEGKGIRSTQIIISRPRPSHHGRPRRPTTSLARSTRGLRTRIPLMKF